MIFATTVLALVSTMAAVANAHAFMDFPNARSSSNQLSSRNGGVKRLRGRPPGNINTVAAGCRNSAKGPSVQIVAAGGSLTVRWVVVANHGGNPRISIAFNGDNNFQQLGQASINARQLTVQMPAGKTGEATIQWFWDARNDGAFYISCADITVGGDANRSIGGNGNNNRNGGGNVNRRTGRNGGSNVNRNAGGDAGEDTDSQQQQNGNNRDGDNGGGMRRGGMRRGGMRRGGGRGRRGRGRGRGGRGRRRGGRMNRGNDDSDAQEENNGGGMRRGGGRMNRDNDDSDAQEENNGGGMRRGRRKMMNRDNGQ
ncbi:hypothetical protein BASA50_004364 [Batrachochytrium salamandrivorans]|uniref:Chitin-binding type-4 domain-containing protein n=1 Tax=Batrachochytrium salamandrivorans TaxID=1357716 RepID=A0ABQ8FFJ1_9FUNG|nr:hypothetical protein BASA60_006574 [Batrachochytrium salamandrivorans]KAH6577444.1 hypothetical protein BASA62_000897 [Batrachochytrium salamandrivorans]KAH6597447.1 hypothetical protein BASA50_004364 [Batrachochytrium salamandrivorans]KAH6602920.1 hypothetical protein BASA61_000636 [Batrachochytrium salamandrivorans]KAH9275281.1 hypothetical protein BASA83_002048 [Batrachochytrium salamandrivorans]